VWIFCVFLLCLLLLASLLTFKFETIVYKLRIESAPNHRQKPMQYIVLFKKIYNHLNDIEQISYDCEKITAHGTVTAQNLLNQSYSARAFLIQSECYDTARIVTARHVRSGFRMSGEKVLEDISKPCCARATQ
jgi:hypothetical protein